MSTYRHNPYRKPSGSWGAIAVIAAGLLLVVCMEGMRP